MLLAHAEAIAGRLELRRPPARAGSCPARCGCGSARSRARSACSCRRRSRACGRRCPTSSCPRWRAARTTSGSGWRAASCTSRSASRTPATRAASRRGRCAATSARSRCWRPWRPATGSPAGSGCASRTSRATCGPRPRPSGIVARACHDAGFEPAIAFTTPDPLAIRALVAGGLAVTLVPRLLAHRAPRGRGRPARGRSALPVAVRADGCGRRAAGGARVRRGRRRRAGLDG